MFGWLKKLGREEDGKLDLAELGRRLGMETDALVAIKPGYREIRLPKATGGHRLIHAPDPELKKLQRSILRRVLRRLRAHPAAHGFERGRSVVSNARPHAARPVVVKMDLQNFFDSTSASRVEAYFKTIGWNREARAVLLKLCTWKGALPQGAPTSPRLSNLVNYTLDHALTSIARRYGAVYTRYADDLTFSFAADEPSRIRQLVRMVKVPLKVMGYKINHRKRLRVLRGHQRQQVTGLVLNAGVNLPRTKRRWLRAVAHHLETGRPATLTPEQLEGWYTYWRMVLAQAQDRPVQ